MVFNNGFIVFRKYILVLYEKHIVVAYITRLPWVDDQSYIYLPLATIQLSLLYNSANETQQ